jgi:Icc-related predicted phosphoesterase
MKINLVSDLHLDYSGYLDMPGGEVLILAGDICEARSMRRDYEDVEPSSQPQPSSEFFTHECAKYEKVFMVMGNHEHYHGRFNRTYSEIVSMLPKNVTLLENQAEEYQGVMFLGGTLWTDINQHDPLTEWHLRGHMSDYKLISNFHPEKSTYIKITPLMTAQAHAETKQYFESVLKDNRDKKCVVITHHAPSFKSIHKNYAGDHLMNGGYVSDLSDFILDNPNISFWNHGHTHFPFDYMIGETRVLCNPRGYLPYEAGNGFDVNFTFEV